jgi:hypothetical protein
VRNCASAHSAHELRTFLDEASSLSLEANHESGDIVQEDYWGPAIGSKFVVRFHPGEEFETGKGLLLIAETNKLCSFIRFIA